MTETTRRAARPTTKKTGKAGNARTRANARTKTKKTPEKLFVVGIGASAGGLEALRPFVAHLPVKSSMAYVLVQHLSPQYRSMMVQLLSRETALDVVELTDGLRVEPNTIYITPPNKDVRIKDGRVGLREPSSPIGPKPSVDVFFSSLAEDFGENAIGVVLSGTGSDGAHGVRVLKASEGFTIAQDPNTAKYDGMPQSAIATGCVDLVLPPEKMGEELLQLSQFPRSAVVRKVEAAGGSDTLQSIFDLVRRRTNVDFSQYKMTTIHRRLERRLAANRIDSLEDYYQYVQGNPTELDLLCKDILISVTAFFRDKAAFEEIDAKMSELVAGKAVGDNVRLWIPGCATGQEAYSFAMMLSEHLGAAANDYRIQIFATDIDTEAMSHARKGIYTEPTLENLEQSYIDRYFDPLGQAYQVKKRIRDMVVFARQDVAKDPPFVKVDLISCRNLLIYFNPELQRRVLQLFHYALNPDGYLFLGKSESIGHGEDLFRAVDTKAKIFQKRLVKGIQPGMPDLPYQPRIGEEIARDPSRRQPSLEEIIREGFIQACMPASVAVNDHLDILYLHGDVSEHVKLPQGAPTNNLAELVRPEYRTELRALAHRAATRNQTVRGSKKRLPGEEDRAERMVVRPLPAQGLPSGLLLVSWEEVEAKDLPPAQASSEEEQSRVLELEHELTATREHLQTIVEELETSNEELQALNEELQASNEELQSSNEELETSNEELQSTNEELTTVNQELQVRTAEVVATNADLQNVLDNVGFPLLVVDRNMYITRYTPQAVRLFGMLPSDVGQLITTVPSHMRIPELETNLLTVMDDGESRELPELRFDHRIYRLAITPYHGYDDSVSGAVLAFIDETEIRQAKNALEKTVGDMELARHQAEQASHAKSDFLAKMSHELRTPLNAILGFSEVIASEMFGEIENDRYRDYAKIVYESGASLLELIDQVLDLSKIEAGKMKIREEVVDVGEVVASTKRLLFPAIEAKGIAFSWSPPDDGKPALVRGDAGALRRVLTNLVGNAVKFSLPGGVIDLSVAVDRIDGQGLEIIVADDGPGIAPGDLARITEPFEQVEIPLDGGEHLSQKGVGLGLTIARSLIEMHEGGIFIDSQPGQGTRVTVRLPAHRLLDT